MAGSPGSPCLILCLSHKCLSKDASFRLFFTTQSGCILIDTMQAVLEKIYVLLVSLLYNSFLVNLQEMYKLFSFLTYTEGN